MWICASIYAFETNEQETNPRIQICFSTREEKNNDALLVLASLLLVRFVQIDTSTMSGQDVKPNGGNVKPDPERSQQDKKESLNTLEIVFKFEDEETKFKVLYYTSTHLCEFRNRSVGTYCMDACA